MAPLISVQCATMSQLLDSNYATQKNFQKVQQLRDEVGTLKISNGNSLNAMHQFQNDAKYWKYEWTRAQNQINVLLANVLPQLQQCSSNASQPLFQLQQSLLIAFQPPPQRRQQHQANQFDDAEQFVDAESALN